MQNTCYIPAQTLEDFAANLLEAGGFAAEESRITAHSLIAANLNGHDSHGIIRVPEYIDHLKAGLRTPNVTLKILHETENSIAADGQKGLGQVQMPRLLRQLFDKAQKAAVVTGTICNCGHVGCLGEWVEQAAEQGFVALMTVNDNGKVIAVAPPGGKQARTSTNPLAFAAPLPDGDIFSMDLSTSATALGKARVAQIEGKNLPPGLIQDADGNPAEDPSILFTKPKGAVLPMGGADQGYKGFALSIMVDLLSAGLSGGFTPPAPENIAYFNTVMLTLWNPEMFAGAGHMREQAGKYLDFVRACAPIDPSAPVRIPGDRTKAERTKRQAEGIPLGEGLRRTLMQYAQDYATDCPDSIRI